MDGIQSFLNGLRPEVRSLPPYNSGLSGEYVRARYGVQEIAKLGSNENPWGASQRVLSAIAEAVSGVALYPDPASDDLRVVLAEHLQVSPNRLVLGNGSEDLISIAAHTFLAPAMKCSPSPHRSACTLSMRKRRGRKFTQYVWATITGSIWSSFYAFLRRGRAL